MTGLFVLIVGVVPLVVFIAGLVYLIWRHHTKFSERVKRVTKQRWMVHETSDSRISELNQLTLIPLPNFQPCGRLYNVTVHEGEYGWVIKVTAFATLAGSAEYTNMWGVIEPYKISAVLERLTSQDLVPDTVSVCVQANNVTDQALHEFFDAVLTLLTSPLSTLLVCPHCGATATHLPLPNGSEHGFLTCKCPREANDPVIWHHPGNFHSCQTCTNKPHFFKPQAMLDHCDLHREADDIKRHGVYMAEIIEPCELHEWLSEAIHDNWRRCIEYSRGIVGYKGHFVEEPAAIPTIPGRAISLVALLSDVRIALQTRREKLIQFSEGLVEQDRIVADLLEREIEEIDDVLEKIDRASNHDLPDETEATSSSESRELVAA